MELPIPSGGGVRHAKMTCHDCQNGRFYVGSKLPGAASRFRAAVKIYGMDFWLGRLDIESVILREIEIVGAGKCLLCG